MAEKQMTIAEWKAACDKITRANSSNIGGAIVSSFAQALPPIPKVVRYSESAGVPSFDVHVDGCDFWYEIECDRCDTPEKLVGWINHLCDKTWMTTEHVKQLIQVAAAKYPGICNYGA